MQSILTTSQDTNRTVSSPNNNNDIETTGTVAMQDSTPIFNIPTVNYDLFIPTNPFSLNIDYGNYAEQEEGTLTNNSLFMQGFANAMSILAESGYSIDGFGGASTSANAVSTTCSAGSCSVGGGFTSVG